GAEPVAVRYGGRLLLPRVDNGVGQRACTRRGVARLAKVLAVLALFPGPVHERASVLESAEHRRHGRHPLSVSRLVNLCPHLLLPLHFGPLHPARPPRLHEARLLPRRAEPRAATHRAFLVRLPCAPATV